jgi:hypothetical protein
MIGRLMAVIVVMVLRAVVARGQALAATPSPDCAEMKTRLTGPEARLKDWPAARPLQRGES